MHIVIHRLVYVRLLDVTSWHRPSICELIYVTRLVASIYLSNEHYHNLSSEQL